jgi:hypothetical protein
MSPRTMSQGTSSAVWPRLEARLAKPRRVRVDSQTELRLPSDGFRNVVRRGTFRDFLRFAPSSPGHRAECSDAPPGRDCFLIGFHGLRCACLGAGWLHPWLQADAPPGLVCRMRLIGAKRETSDGVKL